MNNPVLKLNAESELIGVEILKAVLIQFLFEKEGWREIY